MAGKIFINYRRGDDPGFTGRLFDQLDHAFGSDRLFMDVDSIDPGLDFVEVLSEQVARCDVFLAVIGQSWLNSQDEFGQNRLDSASDFVRIEIESALGQGKRVIPVLVNDAKLPSADDLPESLKSLVRRNAVRLTHDRFRADSAGLIRALQSALEEAEQARLAEEEERRRTEENEREEAQRRADELAQQKREKERLEAISGLSPEDIAKATELVNWRHIEESNRAEDFRDHLARFPDGACAPVARSKLEAIAWNELGGDTNAEALEAFLTEFPEGEHASEARSRLSHHKKAAEEAERKADEDRRLNAAWDACKDANSAKAIDVFLSDWPTSEYAGEARNMLATIQRAERSANDTPSSRHSGPIVIATIAIGCVIAGFAIKNIGTVSNTESPTVKEAAPRSVVADFPPLPEDAPNPQFTPQVGHGFSVSSVAISPDGRWLASTGHDTIKVWDARERHLVRTIKSKGTFARDITFSPDGRQIATSGRKTINLWDPATGALIRTFEGHSSGVLSVAFSPDGKLLASGSIDESAKIWDVATGRELKSFDKLGDFVQAVSFSPDGTQFAVGSRELKIWSVGNWELIRTLEGHDYGVNAFSYSPDGSLIATGDAKGPVRIWEASSGLLVNTLPGHEYRVLRLSFSSDSRTLVTTGSDTIKLWRVGDGSLLQTVADGEERVFGLAYFPNGEFFATGNEVGNLHIRSAADGGSVHTFENSGLGVKSVAFSPDGRQIVSGGRDGIIRLWNVESGRIAHEMKGHGNQVNTVAYSADGRRVASAGGDSMMRGSQVIYSSDASVNLWDPRTGGLVSKLEGHFGGVLALAFSPDGNVLASGGQQNIVFLWDAATSKKLHKLQPENEPLGDHGYVKRVWFSRDGKTVYGANFISEIFAWDVETGQYKGKQPGKDSDHHPVISTDGRIRAERRENEIDLVDQTSGTVLVTLATLPVRQWVSYTPSGDYLASSDLAERYFSVASGMKSFAPSKKYIDRHRRSDGLQLPGGKGN